MIDYGSPPASPEFSNNNSFDSNSINPSTSSSPHKLMSKEEWLKLGGYGNEVEDAVRTSRSNSNSRTSFDTSLRPQSPTPSISSMSATTSRSNNRVLRSQEDEYEDTSSSTRRTRNAPSSTSAFFPSRPSPYKLPSIEASPHNFLQSAESTSISTFSSKPVISIPAGIKRPHVRKRSANHIPRPRNAFILFRSHAVSSGLIPAELGVNNHKNVSKVIGEVWRNLEEEEKQVWDRMAEEEKRQHGVKYPGYKYSPKKTATTSFKSRPISKEKTTDVSQKLSSKRTRGGKSSFSPKTILDADSDDDYDILVSDDEDELSEIEEEEIAPSPRKKLRARPDISQRRVEAIAEALLQGESKGIAAVVDRKLGIVKTQTKKVQQYSNQSNDNTQFTPTTLPPFTSSPTFALPWTPTKRASTSNDHVISQQIFGSPSLSTNTPFRNQPSSDNTSSSNSTISPDRKHSRFARRSNGSPGSINFQSPYNTPTKSRPPLSTSTSGSNPFEINRLPKNDSGDGSSTMQRDQSYAMAQLGVKFSPSDTISPYTLPPPRIPSYSTSTTTLPPHFTYDTLPTPQFDNSPLLLNSPSSLNPTGRKFSLGRWERKASTSISQRELLAQAEEEDAGEVESEIGSGQEYFDFSGASDATGVENKRRTSIFSTLDSRSFLGGIGLGEEEEENDSTTSSFWTGDNNSILSIGDSLIDLQSPTTTHSTSKKLGSEIVGQENFSSSTATQIPLDLFQQFSSTSSDLFSRPLPALFKRTSSVSNTFEDDDSSSSMSWMRGNKDGRGGEEDDSTSGMGSNWDDTRSELEHYFGLIDESDRLR